MKKDKQMYQVQRTATWVQELSTPVLGGKARAAQVQSLRDSVRQQVSQLGLPAPSELKLAEQKDAVKRYFNDPIARYLAFGGS